MFEAIPQTKRWKAIFGGNRALKQAGRVGVAPLCTGAAATASGGALLAVRRLRDALDTGVRPGSRNRASSVATACGERARSAWRGARRGSLTGHPTDHARRSILAIKFCPSSLTVLPVRRYLFVAVLIPR